MEDRNKPKWYFKNWALVFTFLSFGPFMLPLIWLNPNFSRTTKIVITSVIVILSYMMISFFTNSLKSIVNYYKPVSELQF